MPNGTSRFDTFVVGASNKLAATAARAVAESPGVVYNPLFVYGSPGLGKTHLLHALAARARELHPKLRVEYLTLEEMVAQLQEAVRVGQSDILKRNYHDVDVLLVDDVQYLSGRADLQSELLRLFNTLQANGRQVVMAADRSPADIGEVDERLRNRLSGGLVVDLSTPDHASRIAILRALCAERRVRFADGVVEELAKSSIRNVRELQGALNRLIAHQELLGEPVQPSDVWQALGAARVPDGPGEFESFLQDIASGVAASVEGWRLRLGERIAYWSGEGFRTEILEQALALPEPPDVEQLDGSFRAVADRLRGLEAEAIRLNPSHAGSPVFRDPERLREAERLVAQAQLAHDPPPGPVAGYELADLVRTPDNRVALSAVAALAGGGDPPVGPLLLVGGKRSGKTHIVHSLGGVFASRDERAVIACLSADALANTMRDAVHRNDLARWRLKFRELDGLLVDDLQAIDGLLQVQEELANLVEHMCRGGRPVLFASDRPLAAYLQLTERLRACVGQGHTVHIAAPTPSDRLGRFTPVPEGDEAAAPNIDLSPDVDASLAEPEAPFAGEPNVNVVMNQRRALDSFFFDSEKIIAEWPDVAGRLVEELS